MRQERTKAIANQLDKYPEDLVAGLCLKLLTALPDDEVVNLFKQLNRLKG